MTVTYYYSKENFSLSKNTCKDSQKHTQKNTIKEFIFENYVKKGKGNTSKGGVMNTLRKHPGKITGVAALGLAGAFPNTAKNIFGTITAPFSSLLSGVGGIFGSIGDMIKSVIPYLIIGFILFILFKLGIPGMIFGAIFGGGGGGGGRSKSRDDDYDDYDDYDDDY